MTALNLKIRGAIEDSLIAATTIPSEKEKLLKAAGATAREALRKTLPKGFEDAVKTLPSDWFSSEASISLNNDDDNPRWILNNAEDRGSYRLNYLKFEPLHHPKNWVIQHAIYPHVSKDDPKRQHWGPIMAKYVDAANKLRKKEDDLREEIRAVLYSVSSVEKLVAKVPDWEKHIRPHVPAKPMPVVVSTAKAENLLKKAGFDQTEKEAA